MWTRPGLDDEERGAPTRKRGLFQSSAALQVGLGGDLFRVYASESKKAIHLPATKLSFRPAQKVLGIKLQRVD